MRTAAQIREAHISRKKKMGPIHAAGELLRTVYNGSLNVALPELNTNERPAFANLIQTGLDEYARRVASVMPDINCPPLASGKSAQKRADSRKNALMVWWNENALPRKTRRQARYLAGYASAPMVVRPDANKGIPCWELRDPLATFPAPCDPDELVPPDCIFTFRQSLKWLRMYYGNEINNKLTVGDAGPDTMFDILQYIDADQMTMIACGQQDPRGGVNASVVDAVLSNVPNQAGRPLVVIPGRITLDRLQGQFDQMIGMHETQAKLWALQIHAVQRSIFSEQYIISQGQDVEFEPADPYQGVVGKVAGGDIKDFRPSPEFSNLQAIDRLERGERLGGGVPADFGGESPSNVRTARRGQQVMSSAVDSQIQEYQELLAAARQEENAIGIAVAKAYWGNTPRTFVIPGWRQPVTYTPNTTFDTEAQFVRYAYAGTDTNGLVIEGGQRIGMGTESKYTFMRNDPMIVDPDAEHDQIILEGIEAAALSSIQTQAADPNGPYQPKDLARLVQLIYEKNAPLYEAMQTLHDELAAEQAQAQQGQMPQPGLSMPGAPGTPQAGAPIAPPPSGQQNLMNLLSSLRRPQGETPAEAGSVTG